MVDVREAVSKPTPLSKDDLDKLRVVKPTANARTTFKGLPVRIENPAGTQRQGTAHDGTEWETTMTLDYGELPRTEGRDGDPVDVFIGPNEDSNQVLIVHQVRQDDPHVFDEHKVMLGFDSPAEAIEGYLSNYDKGWILGPCVAMEWTDFLDWLVEDTTEALVPGLNKRDLACNDWVPRVGPKGGVQALNPATGTVLRGKRARAVLAKVQHRADPIARAIYSALKTTQARAHRMAPMRIAATLAPLVHADPDMDEAAFEAAAIDVIQQLYPEGDGPDPEQTGHELLTAMHGATALTQNVLTRLAKNVRRYIKDPGQAPEGKIVQRGERGGLYYEAGGGGHARIEDPEQGRSITGFRGGARLTPDEKKAAIGSVTVATPQQYTQPQIDFVTSKLEERIGQDVLQDEGWRTSRPYEIVTARLLRDPHINAWSGNYPTHPDTAPWWLWAAKRTGNQAIPSEVFEGIRDVNSSEATEFDRAARVAQAFARRNDPSYDPDTDTILVYRGIGGDPAEKALAGHPLSPRTLESWSTDPAEGPGFGTTVLEARIPVEHLVGSWSTTGLASPVGEYVFALPDGMEPEGIYDAEEFWDELHEAQDDVYNAWNRVVERLAPTLFSRNERIYVKSPQEVPEGATMRRGKRGGFYYEGEGRGPAAPEEAPPSMKEVVDLAASTPEGQKLFEEALDGKHGVEAQEDAHQVKDEVEAAGGEGPDRIEPESEVTDDDLWSPRDDEGAAGGEGPDLQASGRGKTIPEDRHPGLTEKGQKGFPEGWHKSPLVEKAREVSANLKFNARKDPKARPVAFDLDKTLWLEDDDLSHEPDKDLRYRDPRRIARLKAIQESVAKARAVKNPLVFVTGRSSDVRDELQARLDQLGLDGILVTQDDFTGYADMEEFKANAMKKHNVEMMVGDHPSDLKAAEAAGVPFMHAEEWHRQSKDFMESRESLVLFERPHEEHLAEAIHVADRNPFVKKAREDVKRYHGNDSEKAHRDPETGEWSEERKKIHADIIDNLLNEDIARPLPGQKPKIYFTIGAPGSGKGTVLGEMLKDVLGVTGEGDDARLNAVTIDPDKVKKLLPEWKTHGASYLHEESSHVASELQRRAREMGLNTVFDKVGGNANKVLATYKEFRDQGYEMEVHHVAVSPAETIRRIVARFGSSGRWVPLAWALEQIPATVNTYEELKRMGVSRFTRWDSDTDVNGEVLMLEEGP